jgi:hypothetical protein
MNEAMRLAWLEISQMLGEPTREELDVFLRTWQRAKQAYSAPVQSCYCPNCEAMGKELASLKAQPAPVQDIEHCIWARNGNTPCPHTTPPAAQPAVPDAFGTREGEHPQYIQGWNDCRQAMMEMKK